MKDNNEKFKILVISDHALSSSGVGTQTRHLIEGLIKKGCWSFRQFGAAVKHVDYRTFQINDDFIIKPIDGFGDPNLLRVTLATEKPDALFIFTDPRFFIYLFEMEDEIHQICPIVWWHVWDNDPKPTFNKPLYEATDLINCHSHKTYTQVVDDFPDKAHFVPHALPTDLFRKLPQNEILDWKRKILGDNRVDHTVCLWINRNAKRKRPNDVLWSWRQFIDAYVEKHGEEPRATLLMHTAPNDVEGPNLFQTLEMLDLKQHVFFSNETLDFEQMNIIHNISDFCLNISYAEGFGLPTLESMQCGNPIIAVKTGGLTRQVVDHRDGTENGIALDVDLQTMVGSQMVPYIFEDYADTKKIAAAILKLVEMPAETRNALGEKAMKYVESEFNIENTIDLWHNTLLDTIENWRKRYTRLTLDEVGV
jgi:glycosyltransferase involved in cell wall biosynthesis